MNNAETQQAEIVDEFALFGDWSERYQYLIDLGKKLPELPESFKSDTYKLFGCQSQVWIVPDGDASRLRFAASSDSAIVSGLIALVLRVYSGHSAEQILQTQPHFIQDIGLASHLSPTRSNGLTSMLTKIREIAQAAIDTSASYSGVKTH